MTKQELFALIRQTRSFLCVGLDTEPAKLPACLSGEEDPVFEFNRRIIDATIDLAVAYKPNLAFYEAGGLAGWESLSKTMAYLRGHRQRRFIIADAKRGDIGNTSARYAQAFFDPSAGLDADALTVAPYMGEDSVKPFLAFPGKWVVLLALTSNKGADDFQYLRSEKEMLFEKVLKTSTGWGSDENMMYVVGATQASMLKKVRNIIPGHFLLVPGVGAQGGSLEDVAINGMNDHCGLLVNASRSIIYASSGDDFAEKAREQALMMQQQMENLLKQNALIE